MNNNPQQQLTELGNAFNVKDSSLNHSSEDGVSNTISAGSIWFNYSRNPINQSVIDALLALAKEKQLHKKINALFSGEIVNHSEHRPAKHALLRSPLDTSNPDSIAIHQQLDKMQRLAEAVQAKTFPSQSAITDIMSIGIGGSELGPRLVYEALTKGKTTPIKAHFVANIDSIAIADALSQCRPESTIFIFISKTSTTYETVTNFNTLKQWACANNKLTEKQFWQQSFAVTADPQKAAENNFNPDNIFQFWDWVGGRFSLWSAVGLPVALACGMPAFKSLLAGANSIDQHFQNTPLSENLPVMLGLLHTWYSSYLGYPTRCIVPYAEQLKSLPDFLQQLEMESLGKSVDIDGNPLKENTCPIVWGAVGSNAQHAFFQLLHQGTHTVPVDLIAAVKADENTLTDLPEARRKQHNALLANCLAQSKSLMTGGNTGHQGHGIFAGNRPSNLLLLDKITAETVGQLIAVYEHKVFVQSSLWNINAFDQFGVELGKKMANDFLSGDHLDFERIKESFVSKK